MLQSPILMKYISDPKIAENPKLQNFIYKEAPEWVNICVSNNCIKGNFQKWQQKVCSKHFIPKLTNPIRKKFLDELNSSFELLDMFLQSLITSIIDETEDNLISEMHPNVDEITRRLHVLKPTIIDKQISSAILAVQDLCDLCQQVYNDYNKNKKVNIDNVINTKDNCKCRLKKIISMNEDKSKKPKIKRKENTDLTVDEFFAEFDKIKESENKKTDDLLLLI